ncbi:M15 family metallopeptidase [uncultured Akkermansia sp.]|nr:M15 family metallopeptidase [uncultured Akkermansia sp.]
MKSRYYPHIDKAKVFGDHYVRDFSEHSRGVAVDVSLLYARTGKPVDMGGHHDLLDPSSATDSTLVTPSQRRNRMILKKAFEKQGFANYAPEWWHYRLLNEPEPALHYYFPVWDGMASAGQP